MTTWANPIAQMRREKSEERREDDSLKFITSSILSTSLSKLPLTSVQGVTLLPHASARSPGASFHPLPTHHIHPTSRLCQLSLKTIVYVCLLTPSKHPSPGQARALALLDCCRSALATSPSRHRLAHMRTNSCAFFLL